MTTIIKTRKIAVKDTGARLIVPAEIDNKIKDNWNELLKIHPFLFNGPVFSTANMINQDGEVTLECELSDYANYQYVQKYDIGEYSCKNTYAGCLLKSADDRIFVSLNGSGSENEGKIQFIGGVIDSEDRNESGDLDPIIAAKRELFEEAGAVIRDSIVSYGSTYLITDGSKYGIQTIFGSKLNSKEILAAFDEFKNSSDNAEIARIISFGKDNANELTRYEKRHDLGVIDLMKEVIAGL